MPAGAEGGFDAAGAQVRPLPEQLKVFRPVEDPESEQTAPKMLGMFYTSSDSPGRSVFASSLFQVEPSPRHQRKALNISEPFAVSVPLRVSAVISTNSTPCRTPPKELQSLSSLEEFSCQGSDSGAWPEEEKPPGAESSPASVPKKAVREEPTPELEALGTAECGQSLSPKPSAPLEKKPLEVPPCAPLSKELEKTPDAEKSVEESGGASQLMPSPAGDSPRARAEAMLLHEMDEDDLTNLIWPEIQQELKIIESEEELSSVPPVQRISPIQAMADSSPATFPSPEASGNLPCGATPVEKVCAKDSSSQSTQGAAILTNREKLGPISSLPTSEPEQGMSPDQTRLAPVDIVPLETVSPPARTEERAPGNLCPPLPPSPPPPASLEEWPGVLLLKNGPDRAGASRDSGTHPSPEQPEFKDGPVIPSPCQREEATASHSEKQNPKNVAPEPEQGTCPAFPSPTKEADVVPRGEGEVTHSVQEHSDCDDDDIAADVAQHGLEMVEPWEEPQWVTSPLHSPTLKEVHESHAQGSQGHRLERRLCHRPSLRQSHSLDSKITSNSPWTLQVSTSSSCANLEIDVEPLQPLTARIEKSGWEEKVPRTFAEFSDLRRSETLPSQQEPAGGPPKPVETSCVSLVEEKEQGPELGSGSLQMKQDDVPGSDSSKKDLSRAQDNSPPGEHPPKLQPKNTECGPSRGKHRPSSLNLDSTIPIADLFRLENGASFSSPGIQLSEPGDPKATWMSSSHCKADLWKYSQDNPDLDMVAHALTGRRNSAPVSVSAVRTSFMVKMCQAKAVPVIPPKVQYTQIPQPLPSQSTGEGGAQSPDRNQEAPSSTSGTPPKTTKDDSPSALESPKEERPKQETGAFMSPRRDIASCPCEVPTLPPEPDVPNPLSTQDAAVQCRKLTSETEPSGDNLLPSKLERAPGGPKPFHRARPGRPQSLILFPIMDHLHPASTVTDSKVLLSPIRSPTQTVSPGLLCGELAENTWVTPEGVTLRNKMTIPKNGQRLETSTSCFYQPQRRSVILDGRSGRQIE